jgi:succinate-semialdehyde dehydrogenase / glutarate-semialdehyde dehydrogenase
VKKLKVGNGFEPGVLQGPLIDQAAVEKVEEHIQDAVSQGGRVLLGGKRHALGKTFFEPTVLADITPKMKVAREETFGPVAPLFRFQTDEQAIKMANDTEFGLASYFYSRDIGRVWQAAEGLGCGMVGINTGLISNEAFALLSITVRDTWRPRAGIIFKQSERVFSVNWVREKLTSHLS